MRVNNAPVALEKDQTQFYIPLTGHTADEYLLVELKYTLPSSQSRLELPEFPEDPAVQQVFLAAYLPEEQKMLGTWGNWSEEGAVEFGSNYHQPAQTDAQLLAWVISEVPGVGQPANMPIAGNRYLYSALRPAPKAAGAATLVTIHKYGLWSLTVLLVVGVGLILTRQPFAMRLWWLAALVVAIVLSALFAPMLANAVLSRVFGWSLALVLLVWLVQFLIWAGPLAANMNGNA